MALKQPTSNLPDRQPITKVIDGITVIMSYVKPDRTQQPEALREILARVAGRKK